MEFEIKETQNDVTFEIPAVNFPAYTEYLEKAEEIASYIDSLEVNEDNIKETKHTLAEARRLTDRLNEERIRMKKEILQNFNIFEGQVKEIAGVIDEADKNLRAKVKALEDIERQQKKEEIRHIWDLRIRADPMIEKIMPDAFDRWMSPRYLNKSVSMKTVESEMTQWMSETSDTMKTASEMGDEYLAAYGRTGNLSVAINEVKRQKAAMEVIRETKQEETIETATFTVYGTKDIALTERILKENEINYRKEN